MKRVLSAFASACNGRLVGADRDFAEVSIDTRKLSRGDLFVALRGEHVDGHAFAAAAAAAGAAAAVVTHAVDAPLPQIVVADTQAALSAAAMQWRRGFTGPLIGVAGSNGKTTVKEMLAAILSQAGACLATRGNLNNHLGVPLTLLRLDAKHRSAVIEMGANRAGDVAALLRIAHPAVGLITNAGAEHLEGFGSLEGVARAEGEMVAGLEASGTAVINADDTYAPLWRSMTSARILSFGMSREADFRAEDIRAEVNTRGFSTRFELIAPQGRIGVELALAGQHNIQNALAAAAGAVAAGATLDAVASGLATMRAVAGRLQLRLTPQGAWLIDDSYNANPSSVRAGLDVLAALPGRKWLVLGDMAELGDFAAASHREAGRLARERGVERLYAFGRLAALAAEEFGSGAQCYGDVETLSRALLETLGADVRVLVKGSRFNRLERVVNALAPATDARRAG
jgi:UDP-N-acetylmuramoyl-tripeptide--D-alanyl-D-alanine ligase